MFSAASANVTVTLGATVSTATIGRTRALPAFPATSLHTLVVKVTLAIATSLDGVKIAVNTNGSLVATSAPKTPDVVVKLGMTPGASLNVNVR
jgi:hypothetical protein